MTSEFVVNYEVLENTEKSQKKEWLETNGLGAYASSTILDCHTRKYHGYLVSPIENCPGRFVLLSKIDAVVLAGENEFGLGTNKFPDVFHPTGHRYAERNSRPQSQPSTRCFLRISGCELLLWKIKWQ